jgi:hypothetical protein
MAALAVVVLGMLALGGTPALAGPPLTHPEDLASWLTARPPVEAAFAVLRLVVLVLAAYLLAVTVLGVALRLVRAGRLVRAVDLVTLPAVRRVVGSAFGVGLMGAPLAVVGPTAPAGVAQVQLVVGAAAPLQPGGTCPSGRRRPRHPRCAAWTSRRRRPPPRTDVVVGAGDHLWSVADRALTGAWGRAASDAELTPYWEQVVEVNRERLADPGNPDLLFPGQVVSVPTPPAAPPA